MLAYVVYKDLYSPDEVLEKMYDYLKNKAFDFALDLTDDLDIYNKKENDGKKFTVYNRTGEYFLNFRSANGINIFGITDEIAMDGDKINPITGEKEKVGEVRNPVFQGIGLVGSEGWTTNTRWYNQYNVPRENRGDWYRKSKGKFSQVCGAYMPVPNPVKPDMIERRHVPVYVKHPFPPTPPIEPKPPEKPKIPPFKVRYWDDDADNDGQFNGKTMIDASSGKADFIVVNSMFHRYSPDFVTVIGVQDFDLSYKAYKDIDGFFEFPDHAAYNLGANVSDSKELTYNDLKNTSYKFHSSAYGYTDLDGMTEAVVLESDIPKYRAIHSDRSPMQAVMGNGTNRHRFCLTSYCKSTSTKFTQWHAQRVFHITNETWQKILNAQKNLDDYNNKTSPEWMQYKNDKSQYDKDKAQYDKDKIQYGKDKADFDNFITRLKEYMSFPAEVQAWAETMFTYYNTLNRYFLYCNDVLLNPTSTTLFSLVKQPHRQVLDIGTFPVLTSTMPTIPDESDPKSVWDAYEPLMEQFVKDLRDYDTELWNYIMPIWDGTSVVYDDDKINWLYFYQTTHLVFGDIDKYGTWDGGLFFSGSANHNMMATCYTVYSDYTETGLNLEPDNVTLPILASCDETNTYLRIDIDEANTEDRNYISWASSGTDNLTGKRMSLPVRAHYSGDGQIPNYADFQSKTRTDWGKDISILSGMSLKMPIFMAVQPDPDSDIKYAPAGGVSGMSFCCLLNMQNAGVYKFEYPRTTSIDQVFTYGKRRGYYGFDGCTILQ